jgi:bifunctional DNase/RNase
VDVPVEISRILITELGDQQVIFLKEKNGPRNFPILIGLPEALAIDRRIKEQSTLRPMTHDLLAAVIAGLGGEVEKIVINDIRDHTFIATIYIRRGEEIIEIDSRPSDALALGAGLATPIYVADHVISDVLAESVSKKDRIELLRRRMEMLAEKISEVEERLADDDFLATASTEDIENHRRLLEQMQHEYDAIDRVLKKLG